MRSRALVFLAVLIAPCVSAAQSPVMRPKQQAQRAVANVNAHTAAMTDSSAGRVATPPSTMTASRSRTGSTASSPNADTTRTRRGPRGKTALPDRATFEREVFSYARGGRRDPFISLMTTGDIRPLLPDLRLVGIAYDTRGRTSVAVLREDAQEPAAAKGATKSMADVPMYRVKEGQQIGRMRVARIGPKSVTFTIEEFGYSRQETLTLSESNTEKKP